MTMYVVYVFAVLYPCNVYLQLTCTALSNINPVYINQKLNGYTIKKFPAEGLMICARECLVQTNCLSFNFDLTSGGCELNRIEANTSNSPLVSMIGTVYALKVDWVNEITELCQHVNCPPKYKCIVELNGTKCVLVDCGEPPIIMFGNKERLNGTAFGDTATYTCSGVEVFSEVINLQCSNLTGEWEGGRCRRVASCEDVKLCSSGHVDGEYWLYPMVYGNTNRVKIYCHNLTSEAPSEYITLPQGNEHFYPASENIYNEDQITCKTVIRTKLRAGSSVFDKVGVDVETMVIRQTDYQFAQVDWGLNSPYGDARDCSLYHPLCDNSTVGYFEMNTTNTGLVIDPTIEWLPFGWAGQLKYFNRSSANTVIEVVCGGYCGGCKPQSDLRLQIDPDVALDDNLATTVSCISNV
ncbi:hypothetical protein SNE40_005414 [Patella caerulea]|uniref:Uncharacterized protein n=1 Tax=Patella caerulea TaxID=87958 RepID=A0AAN8K0Z1_PATCE